MKYLTLEAILQAALSASNEVRNYPDAISMVQDVLQEKYDNGELSVDGFTGLQFINELIYDKKL